MKNDSICAVQAVFQQSFHPMSTGMFIAKGLSSLRLSLFHGSNVNGCFDFACLYLANAILTSFSVNLRIAERCVSFCSLAVFYKFFDAVFLPSALPCTLSIPGYLWRVKLSLELRKTTATVSETSLQLFVCTTRGYNETPRVIILVHGEKNAREKSPGSTRAQGS